MTLRLLKNRCAYSGDYLKFFFIGGAVLFALSTFLIAKTSYTPPQKDIQKNESAKILTEIYEEIRELGYRKNETFIKREFHFDLDKNASNSEEHILVLSYDDGKKLRMVVQITYFETRKNNLVIKYAKEVKFVSCFMDHDRMKIEKCDYSDKEMNPVLKQILQGIREEKELFKLIKDKR